MRHPRRCWHFNGKLLLLGQMIVLLRCASWTSHRFLRSWFIVAESRPQGQVKAVSSRRNIVSGMLGLSAGLQAVPARAQGKRKRVEESSLTLYRTLEDIAQEIVSVQAGGVTGDQVRDFMKVQLVDRRLVVSLQNLGTLLPAACVPDPDTAPPQEKAIESLSSLRGKFSGGVLSGTLRERVLKRLQLGEKQLLQFLVCVKKGAAKDGATQIVTAAEEAVIKEKGAKGVFPWKDFAKWSPADLVEEVAESAEPTL